MTAQTPVPRSYGAGRGARESVAPLSKKLDMCGWTAFAHVKEVIHHGRVHERHDSARTTTRWVVAVVAGLVGAALVGAVAAWARTDASDAVTFTGVRRVSLPFVVALSRPRWTGLVRLAATRTPSSRSGRRGRSSGAFYDRWSRWGWPRFAASASWTPPPYPSGSSCVLDRPDEREAPAWSCSRSGRPPRSPGCRIVLARGRTRARRSRRSRASGSIVCGCGICRKSRGGALRPADCHLPTAGSSRSPIDELVRPGHVAGARYAVATARCQRGWVGP